MPLWWVGNLLLLVAVLPLLVVLLRAVLVAAQAVRRTVAEIAAVSTAMVTDLDPVAELDATRRFAGETSAGLVRYGRALDEIL
ncbi:MAG: hypothetical protein H0T43_04770 [Solirubrobacterales bacterium]|nr:hypothetical protein [Solirubrobacterales bacterium]